jgi:hypothetical protein
MLNMREKLYAFMGREDSLLFSQEPATGLYSDPDEPNPQPNNATL